ncbi:hypothetical protein Fcan01_10196 [Folsomia candida]|uniref:Uncharacterized protein n=1 Tax=Folsomia candida TaxID=158441 RepID=A0A226EBL8_FOLCA|nr:hypothetical protein Fcan01_10196 [Folsomia candida]
MARKNNADLTWNANKESARDPTFCLYSMFLSHKVSSINFISKMSSIQVNKFCIIQIDCNGEKFVEIAPTIWLEEEEKFVFWPPASKLKSFSKKGTVHPLPSWRRQTYQKILGKYDTWKLACEKVKIAEDTSNLGSAAENHLEGRRKKNSRELSHPNVSSSGSEDDEENSILVSPPPMNDEGSTEVQLSTQDSDNIPSVNQPEVINLEGQDIGVLLATSTDINDLKKLIEGKS